MPNIPVAWLAELTANLTTANNQFDPDIIQLANGNILVAWTSNDTGGVASDPGDDIIGQIFDPLGNRVGVEFRVNDFALANNERDVDMAALPGGGGGNGDSGGFLAVYERANITTGLTEICLDQKSNTGTHVQFSFVVSDSAVTDPNYQNPHVAVSGATSALVVYEELNGGVATIEGKIYNPTTGAYGAQISLIAFAGGDTEADVTALTNGNYVVTATSANSGDNRIIYRIVNSAGANVLGVTEVAGTGTNAQSDNDASVTALAGGGFVVAWTNFDGTDVDGFFRVYNAAGTETGSGVVGNSTNTNNNNELVVTGLSDGSFVIVYDNDETDQAVVEHFTAAGANLGTFSFAGPNTTPAVTDLGDGRFAVTWQNQTSGEISFEILDTRDAPNNPSVYTPDPWIVGTIGNDLIHGTGAAESIGGGLGLDFIIGEGGADKMDGGANFDSVSFLNLASAVTLNLTNQSFNGGAAAGVTLANFEAYYLTNFGDTFVNNSSGGYIYGFGGADILNGNAGTDFIEGGTGGDAINAAGGFDYVSYVNAAAGITLNLITPAANTGEAAGDTIVNAEAFYLTGFGDIFVGQTGQNIVFGGGGGDSLFGGVNSSDWLFGEAGNDFLSAGAFDDLLSGGAGSDTFAFNSWVGNGFDSILDFVSGTDKIQLGAAGFGLPSGQHFFGGVNFFASASPFATQPIGTLLYATGLGILYYDPDGSGAAAAIALAQLSGAPAVTVNDFIVV